MCQDTGTAIVMGKKSEGVLTGADDAEADLARGVRRLHAAQPALLPARAADDVRREEHRHQPAGADRALLGARGDEPAYKFLFMAKGGGSANKSFLYQETKAILNPQRMLEFLDEKLRSLGTAACPPYHLAVVIGGTSAEYALKTAKLRLGPLPRPPADRGLAGRPRLPRPRARGGGLRADPGVRHRRAVRRQVLLPRRAGGPAAAPRRVVPGRDRGVLLRRPAGARQDHRRGRLPRAARDRPGPLPARRRYGGRRSPAARSCRSTSTGRWPRSWPSCRSTRSRPGSRSPGRWSWPATSPTPRSRSGSTPARRCRRTCATTRSTTPARRRRPRAWPPARSARPRPAGWTPTSSSSRPPAARW